MPSTPSTGKAPGTRTVDEQTQGQTTRAAMSPPSLGQPRPRMWVDTVHLLGQWWAQTQPTVVLSPVMSAGLRKEMPPWPVLLPCVQTPDLQDSAIPHGGQPTPPCS